jgi:hypothetical protein
MGYANAVLDAPVASIPGQPTGILPGRGGPYFPEPWQTSTSGAPLHREEALQINGSFDMRNGRAGYGTDTGIPGQSTPLNLPGTQAFYQYEPSDLERAAGLLNMMQGGPEFATIAGDPVDFRMLPGPGQVVMGGDPAYRLNLMAAPQTSDAVNAANDNPTKFLKMFNRTEFEETRQGIAARVVNWAANAALTAATMKAFAADPVLRPYLSNAGLNIQALLPSRGYGNGKRKRSVRSSFAVGRGRKKGRR